VLVAMPHELALQLGHLHIEIVHLTRDVEIPFSSLSL
jgi:hypothetical protein